MALTALELTLMRQQTGGATTGNEPDHLTDDQINALYAANADDFDDTIIPVIRTRLGMAAVYVNGQPEFGIEQYEARWQHLKYLLAYYEELFGSGRSGITVGKLKHNINTKLADLDGS